MVILGPEENVGFCRFCQPRSRIWEIEKREENESSAVGGLRLEVGGRSIKN
jgi:hypothetical protein